jgi:hypothetical protein
MTNFGFTLLQRCFVSIIVALLLCSGGALSLAEPVFAQNGTPDTGAPANDSTIVDIVILIDNSTSIRATDRQELRFEAVRFLIDYLQLNEQDQAVEFRVAILTFGDTQDTTELRPLRPVADETAPDIEQIAPGAIQITDFRPPLAAAIDTFENAEPRADARFVFLFTDGRPAPDGDELVDDPAALADYFSSQAAGSLSTLITRLERDQQAEIFVLALPITNANVQEVIADSWRQVVADEQYLLLEDTTDLFAVYRDAFDQLLNPATTPPVSQTGQDQTIEFNVEEPFLDGLILSFTRNDPDTTVLLRDPDGNLVEPANDGTYYLLYYLDNPATGVWQAEVQGNVEYTARRVYPEIRLDLPARIAAGEMLTVTANLVRNDGTTIPVSLLQGLEENSTITLELSDTTEVRRPLELTSNGLVSTFPDLLPSRQYTVTVAINTTGRTISALETVAQAEGTVPITATRTSTASATTTSTVTPTPTATLTATAIPASTPPTPDNGNDTDPNAGGCAQGDLMCQTQAWLLQLVTVYRWQIVLTGIVGPIIVGGLYWWMQRANKQGREWYGILQKKQNADRIRDKDPEEAREKYTHILNETTERTKWLTEGILHDTWWGLWLLSSEKPTFFSGFKQEIKNAGGLSLDALAMLIKHMAVDHFTEPRIGDILDGIYEVARIRQEAEEEYSQQPPGERSEQFYRALVVAGYPKKDKRNHNSTSSSTSNGVSELQVSSLKDVSEQSQNEQVGSSVPIVPLNKPDHIEMQHSKVVHDDMQNNQIQDDHQTIRFTLLTNIFLCWWECSKWHERDSADVPVGRVSEQLKKMVRYFEAAEDDVQKNGTQDSPFVYNDGKHLYELLNDLILPQRKAKENPDDKLEWNQKTPTAWKKVWEIYMDHMNNKFPLTSSTRFEDNLKEKLKNLKTPEGNVLALLVEHCEAVARTIDDQVDFTYNLLMVKKPGINQSEADNIYYRYCMVIRNLSERTLEDVWVKIRLLEEGHQEDETGKQGAGVYMIDEKKEKAHPIESIKPFDYATIDFKIHSGESPIINQDKTSIFVSIALGKSNQKWTDIRRDRDRLYSNPLDKRLELTLPVLKTISPAESEQMHNRYVSTSPIIPGGNYAFIRTKEYKEIIHKLWNMVNGGDNQRQSWNQFWLCGLPHTGKTSLLYDFMTWCKSEAEEDKPIVTVYIDVEHFRDDPELTAETFFYWIKSATWIEIRKMPKILDQLNESPQSGKYSMPSLAEEYDRSGNNPYGVARALKRLASDGDFKIVFLFDHADLLFETLETQEQTSYLANELYHDVVEVLIKEEKPTEQRMSVVFVTTPRIDPITINETLPEQQRGDLQALSWRETRELTRKFSKPLELSSGAEEYIWQLTGGFPVLVQALSGQMIDTWLEQHKEQARATKVLTECDVDAALKRLLSKAGHWHALKLVEDIYLALPRESRAWIWRFFHAMDPDTAQIEVNYTRKTRKEQLFYLEKHGITGSSGPHNHTYFWYFRTWLIALCFEHIMSELSDLSDDENRQLQSILSADYTRSGRITDERISTLLNERLLEELKRKRFIISSGKKPFWYFNIGFRLVTDYSNKDTQES